ncbi:MAG TPA: PAS domain S-box protein [Mucilaginibacter sp.]
MQTKLDLYHKVIPLAHLGIWERNLKTGEVYWNKVVKEIYEVDSDFNPTQEKSIEFYVDQDAIRLLIDQAIKTTHTESAQFQVRTKKGNLKWIKVRVKAGFEDGKCSVIYGTIKEITKRVNLVNALAEREVQFHHAFEYAPIGIALVSPVGEWIRVNKMLCQLLGREEQDLLKQTFQDITHPDDLNIDLEQMHQLLDNQIISYQMDKRYFHSNGSIIWVSLSVTLVRDQQNKPLYFVSQIRDITEWKNMEQEQIKAMEIISNQNSRLLNFAHIVSHNLRSHTGNIQMLTDMILKEEDPAEKDNLISMLGINAINLQETLGHLNEVVDVQTNSKLNLKRLNLAKEINRTAGILSGSLKHVSAGLSIQVDSKIYIDYDRAYLESILLNLLTNCIKYRNHKKPLSINIRASDVNQQVILEIEDNGIGIDLQQHGNKLFGMYKTFHGNEDARGIGLFLVKNHVEAMGGNITVESSPEKGTTFRIEFKNTEL